MTRHRIWMAVCIMLTVAAVSVQAQGPVPPLAVARQKVILPSGAKWTAVAAQAKLQPVQIEAVETTARTARLKVTLPGFHQRAVTKQGIKFQRLAIPGGGATAEIGRPEVPLVRQLIAVPPGATATLKVKTGGTKVTKGITLFPVQEPQAYGSSCTAPAEDMTSPSTRWWMNGAIR